MISSLKSVWIKLAGLFALIAVLIWLVLKAQTADIRSNELYSISPYIQSVTHNSARIAYLPAQPGKYKLSLNNLGNWQEVPLNPTKLGLIANITQLSPDTTYQYRVENHASQVIFEGRFQSAPLPTAQRKIRLAAFGDSGSGDTHQFAVAKQIQLWQPEILLHLGDIVYPNGEATLYADKFFKPYSSIISASPLFPTLGNHDIPNLSTYLSIFAPPFEAAQSNNPRYYSFDYGPLHLLALDSNSDLAPGSAQYEWLSKDLSNRRFANIRWTIVYLHHPLHSVARAPQMPWRAAMLQLLNSSKVDLVLAGHDHAYQRFFREDPKGSPTFIVSGGGGKTLYPQQLDNSQLALYRQVFHFIGISASQNELHIDAIDENGANFDQVTLASPTPHK